MMIIKNTSNTRQNHTKDLGSTYFYFKMKKMVPLKPIITLASNQTKKVSLSIQYFNKHKQLLFKPSVDDFIKSERVFKDITVDGLYFKKYAEFGIVLSVDRSKNLVLVGNLDQNRTIKKGDEVLFLERNNESLNEKAPYYTEGIVVGFQQTSLNKYESREVVRVVAEDIDRVKKNDHVVYIAYYAQYKAYGPSYFYLRRLAAPYLEPFIGKKPISGKERLIDHLKFFILYVIPIIIIMYFVWGST